MVRRAWICVNMSLVQLGGAYLVGVMKVSTVINGTMGVAEEKE